MAKSRPRLLVPMSRAVDYLILVVHEATYRRWSPKRGVDDHWNRLFDCLDRVGAHRHVDTRTLQELRECSEDNLYCGWLCGMNEY